MTHRGRRIRHGLWIGVLVGLLGLWIVPETGGAEADTFRVIAIQVEGNHRVERDSILHRLGLEVGGVYTATDLEEAIHRLYQMGYFESVQVTSQPDTEGVRLVVQVQERPVLESVTYTGNVRILTDRLQERATLVTGVPLDPAQILDTVSRIRALYREEGYYQARILPWIEELEPGPGGERRVALTLVIQEGRKVRIREVRLEGVEALEEREVRKRLKTRPYGWWRSWLTGSGIYREEEAQEDVERIRALYLDRGHILVRVGTPQVEEDPTGRWLTVTFPIQEGPRFRVRRIRFQGLELLDEEKVRQQFRIREGMVFQRSLLQQDMLTLTDLYGELGYAFAQVEPRLFPDPEQQEVDVTLVVNKGNQIRVRRIEIQGNTKTRDKVIRREMRLDEGDILNTRKLRRSFQRLNNLNFFETVEITPERVAPDQVDLRIRVKEKPTGTFSMGGGYSSVYGFLGTVDVTEGNLLGRGHLLRVKGEFGALATRYDITFREPYLLDRPTSLTLNAFDTINTFTLYDIASRGGRVGIGRALGEYWSTSFSYGYQKIQVKGAPPPTLPLGESTTGSLSSALVRDTRDNIWDPRSGSRAALRVQWADTFLGGSNRFFKYILDVSWFYPLPRDTAFMIRTRYGVGRGLGGQRLPPNERFFVGGIFTVRGFEFGKAGTPSTVDPQTGEILGADKELIFNLEYIFPLVRESRINGVLFFDAGSGFGPQDSISLRDLRTSVGGGFRWLSPIGPLRLEWGYNLNPRPGERQGMWEFSIGTLF